jgi:D-alanyl-D-alanine carboxypeptidase
MGHRVVRRALPLLLLALLITLTPPAGARAAPGPAFVAALDGALEAARAEAGAQGALLFVDVPGLGAYSGARGVADVATGAPLAPGARVRVASVTKPFVAVVALQLVQEGWLLLDHSVEHWLPGLVPGGEQIRLRHLLGHSSGLPDYLSGGIVGRARREPERVWRPEELVGEALRRPRLFAPGAPGRWAYSNTNYILVGLIIERVTGNPLDQELRQRIIEPLGLRGTALAPPSADPGDLARGYVNGVDYTALNMSVAWAAGGLTSTVDDLGRFTQALLWGGLLGPELMGPLLTFAGTGGAWSPDMAYSLGLMRRTLPAAGLPEEARLAIGHTGALGGYRTAMWHFPASGVTVVAVFTRYEADPNRLVGRALQTLAAQGVLQ